jgi:hypothetical protein
MKKFEIGSTVVIVVDGAVGGSVGGKGIAHRFAN